jgi:hypothetical protein
MDLNLAAKKELLPLFGRDGGDSLVDRGYSYHAQQQQQHLDLDLDLDGEAWRLLRAGDRRSL